MHNSSWGNAELQINSILGATTIAPKSVAYTSSVIVCLVLGPILLYGDKEMMVMMIITVMLYITVNSQHMLSTVLNALNVFT